MQGNSSIASQNPLYSPRKINKLDTLNSEFMYYNSILKVLALALTDEVTRKKILAWIRKLFAPEYHGSQFREKRNKYLLSLSLSLLNDEAYGIFGSAPPAGALKNIEDIHMDEVPTARWENDPTWFNILADLPQDFTQLTCPIHKTKNECANDHTLDVILDQEFKFLLYLAKPYADLLTDTDDRTKIACWLQILCSIYGKNYCSSIKAIRNDYMMVLAGYLHDLRVIGPFTVLPSWTILRPLPDIAKLTAESQPPITHPTNPEANEFLSTQPIPDDGAFCYIALNGDLVNGGLY